VVKSCTKQLYIAGYDFSRFLLQWIKGCGILEYMFYSNEDKIAVPAALVAVILIALTVWLCVRNKSARVRHIPFIVIAVLLLTTESIKQYMAVFYPENGKYELFNLPFHVCSFFLIWFTLAAFAPAGGTLRRIGFLMGVCIGIPVIFSIYFAPKFILFEGSATFFPRFADFNPFRKYSTFNSFFYHHLVLLFVLLVFILKPIKPYKIDAIWACVLCFSILTCSCILAFSLNTNFGSFLDFGDLKKLVPFVEHTVPRVTFFLFGQTFACFLAFWIYYFIDKITRKQHTKRVIKGVKYVISPSEKRTLKGQK
jgi:hypothetical protein